MPTMTMTRPSMKQAPKRNRFQPSPAEMIIDAAPGAFSPETTPEALSAFLDLQAAFADGEHQAKLCQRIALVLADSNGCGGDMAVHQAVARQAGLSEEEILDSLLCTCENPATNAILNFVRMIMADGSKVSEETLKGLWDTGLDDVETAEIIADTVLGNDDIMTGRELIAQGAY